MCGIFAYLGWRPCVAVLLRGLATLEYRGYDSAGLCVMAQDGALQTVKKEGKLARLAAACTTTEFAGPPCLGISHTRWATHGEPNDTNSHPHLSNDEAFAVVHNGVIENKEELKSELKRLGYTFTSETDTEVVPVLLQHYLKVSNSTEDALVRTLTKLKGAYGLAILHRGEQRVYGACLGSPLCIGIGENEMFLASDPSAFVEYTKRVIHINDHEIVTVTQSGSQTHKVVYGKADVEPHLERTASCVLEVPFDIDDVRKGDFPHFMLKEIFDQPRALQNAIGGKIRNIHMVHINLPPVLHGVTFLACGTSMHASLVAEYIIENEVGIPCTVELASEYVNKRCLLSNHDLAIAVSQSGETADTRDALVKAKESGAFVAGIVNVVGSQIARIAGQGMYLHAGPEIGVASTKAFTCQVAVLNVLASFLSRDLKLQQQIMQALTALPALVTQMLDSQELHHTIRQIAATFKDSRNALYLGRGIDYPVALEGALKLKEISYIHAEGYAAGEMKHGPIALIDENMPVFFVIGSCQANFHKVLSNMEEVKARRGRIITVTSEDSPRIRELSEFVILVPETMTCVAPIVKVIPFQLIAYHIAVLKQLDPDQPRNLAKSVTVC
eukprot:gnl/Hemi2/10234_TR3538_c0_g1_i1.p1 gnl/Hemi2/10234_TR3538_c0_g1~~gnl/Hemi2/10234_TR3538_c0_g1_i1.p1  ORF type:complete len:650 (-),score=252.14 gnl/Hemi2/10234_TR3538_c0_g1_i1:531-2372(-)